MTYLQQQLKLWQHYWAKRKKVAAEKHASRMFYKTLDEALEAFNRQPRKYYICKKSEVDWEILGAQEVKKMRKFKVVKEDTNFMNLEERAFVISPDNIDRIKHEQHLRKWYVKWWNLTFRNYYEPVSEWDMHILERIHKSLTNAAEKEHLGHFINKHKQ